MYFGLGLKARATLAWGKAPGRPRHPPPLRGAEVCPRLNARPTPNPLKNPPQASNQPHKPLIKPDTILREHRAHLALKISFPLMVRRLPIDIPHQRVADRSTPPRTAVPTQFHPNFANSGPL